MKTKNQNSETNLFKKIIFGILFLAGVIAGILTAFALLLLVAKLTENRFLAVIASLAGAFGGWGLMRTASRRIASQPVIRQWLPVVGSVVSVAVTIFVFGGLLLAPAPPYTPLIETPNVSYWELPTGSRLAYTHTPAQGTPKPEPVILVHGGPGAPDTGQDVLQNVIAEAGYNVYNYDQIGAGLSERLKNASDYTVERHIRDLDAIRTELKAEKIILIGASWGGTLIANYTAAHPHTVAQAIISSPGPIWPAAYTEETRLTAAGREDLHRNLSEHPRFTFAQMLLQIIGPNAARSLLPDDKMDGVFEQFVSGLNMAPGCSLPEKQESGPEGIGFWVNAATGRDAAKMADPRPQLKEVQSKVLLLRAQCDYISWDVTREYRDLLPNSTLVAVPNAGHTLSTYQPEEYRTIVTSFLTGQPLSLPAYTTADKPW